MTAETDASDVHADGADARATGTHGQTPTSPAGLTLLSDDDLYLFNEGSHSRLYDKLGCHPMTHDGQRGAYVAVWAPNADYVAVIGDFNGWDRGADPLHPRGSAGIWEGFVAGASVGDAYKFHIGAPDGYRVDKADPFATHAEIPPKTASVVWDDDHTWGDQQWMDVRGRRNALDAPMNIYEMHVGSWRRTATDDGDRPLSYRELADPLVDYLTDLNFTHVEFLPVMEHPFGGSWGYQVTGFFAPTSRFGTPEDFKYLVDRLHQAEIGVILDWVPSHFPTDEHGPGYFDGTHLFEHADPRQGIHPDWNSYIFNYGRPEVRSFLLSSALHWLDAYHLDGLRVDAVASMLYLDYSREDGEWIPNEYGGNENLDAIDFLRRLNEEVYEAHPDTQTIAEESTAWPMVSRPTYVGGLGFGMKWDMGWMHDTLEYLREEPIHRSFHHNRLTFRSMYAYTENFCLPLSHDEVVHGKGSLIDKMPGDEWQQFANLRAMFGYMYTTPGKKLLFMGGELAQRREWNHDTQLDWDLLNDPLHAGAQRWLAELSGVYRDEPALHRGDCDPAGWEWVDADDWRSSIITYLRKTGGDGEQPEQTMVVACNFTPVPRHNYLVGVPRGGYWNEVLNSDADEYGGSGLGNLGGVEAAPVGAHGRPHALNLTLPPLAVVLLKAPDTSRATTSTRQPVTGHSRRG